MHARTSGTPLSPSPVACSICIVVLYEPGGTVTVTRRTRFLCTTFIAVVALLAGCSTGAADEPVPVVPWSEGATWGGAVPVAGDDVVIPRGTAVLLDVSPPPLGGLTIEGTLVFDERDLDLTADWIIVHGALRIGTERRPFGHRATLTLVGPPDETVMGMGGRALAVAGGTLDLHGEPRTSWTRLAATARAGTSEIQLDAVPGWRPGDRIVIASTDFAHEQAEEATVAALTGRTVRLEAPLAYEHWGEIQSYGGRSVDERAEVALLSRNVVVQGPADAETDRTGGSILVMAGGTARVQGVELRRMGQAGRLGMYPFHWHLGGDVDGSYLRGSSIHHAYNRCVTVHGAHGATIREVVGYDTYGHCFFLEDGIETRTSLVRNLGLVTRRPEPADAILPSDLHHVGPATFWITNPDNDLIGNVAAGSDGSGFWLAFPEHPTGASTTPDVWPRRTPLGAFAGNVAHSNGSHGLFVDLGPDAAGGLQTASYGPVADPSDPASAPRTAVFDRQVAYKNRRGGIWLRGHDHRVRGAVLADNRVGATFASADTELTESVLIGETANRGTPGAWEPMGEDGRSLPTPHAPDTTITGFEMYDGPVGVSRSYFAGFEPNDTRGAAAIDYLRYTSFPTDPRNWVEGIEVEPRSRAVHFEMRTAPSAGSSGEDGYRSAMFVDRDGSLTGSAGTKIVVNDSFVAPSEACTSRPDWNAAICDGEYAALGLYDLDDGSGGAGPVLVTRDGTATHRMLGTPSARVPRQFRTVLPTEAGYEITYEGTVPRRLRLWLGAAGPGDWIFATIPAPSSEPFLYRDYWIDPRSGLRSVADVDAVLASGGDAYHYDGERLHLKLQVPQGRDAAIVDVCAFEICR